MTILQQQESESTEKKSDETKDADEEGGKDNEKHKGRYVVALRKWDTSSASYKDEFVTEDSKKEAQKDVAYVFRRVVYDTYYRETRAYSELEIESPALVKLMKSEIDNKYPGVNFEGDTIYMLAPFAAIVRPFPLLLLFYYIGTNISIDTQLG